MGVAMLMNLGFMLKVFVLHKLVVVCFLVGL